MADQKTQVDVPAYAGKVARYPGVQPFGDDDAQRHLFYGRDSEKYELLQLVLAERLVLLFARSGVGKSSLINAGLLEPLRSKRYFPLVVRVSGSSNDPLPNLYDSIKAEVAAASERAGIEFEPRDESAWNKASLWHFFKTFEIWREDKLLSPVLILDQFEELFTLFSETQREQLIHELANLVRGTRPRESRNDDAKRISDTPPPVKVVLSLREDFYANLEELRDRIPAIYKAALRLNPLTREQASTAIVEPARLVGESYSTPAFTWSDEALGRILDFLSEQQLGEGKTKLGDEVEPFQLQLICQHFEAAVSERQLSTVTATDLGGNDALRRILSGFYETSLRKICAKFKDQGDLRKKLEHLCEYGFITGRGRRLLREESTIKQEDGIAPEILHELVELRLLRKEPRVGDNYYELTHDTLIEPIQLSRKEREQREARELRMREARQRKKRNRVFAYGAAAVLAVAVAGSAAVWLQAEQQAIVLAQDQVQKVEQQANERVQKVEQQAKKQVKQVKQEARQQTTKVVIEKQQVQVEKLNEVIAKAQAKEQAARAQFAVLRQKAVTAQEQLTDVEKLVAKASDDKRIEYSRQRDHLAKTLESISEEVKTARETQEQAVEERGIAKEKLGQVEVEVARLKTRLQESQMQSLEQEADSTRQQIEEAQQTVEESAGTEVAEAAKKEVAQKKVELAAITEKVEEERTKVDEAKIEQRTVEDQQLKAEILQTNPGAAQGSAESAGAAGDAADAGQYSGVDFKDLSICEQFDVLTNDDSEGRVSHGLEWNEKVQRLAELNAMLERSAVIVTQSNLVISGQDKGMGDPLPEKEFRERQKVNIYIWVSAPARPRQYIKIEYLDGNGRTVMWDVSGKKVSKRTFPVLENRLRGERLGYRIHAYRNARAPGPKDHQIRIYNNRDQLLCQRAFKVTGG
jgi:hypothetical protein